MGVQIGQVCAARTRTCDAADAAPNRQLRAWRWTVAGHKTSGPAGLVWHQGRRETCWPARRARPYGPSVRRSPQEKKALSYARDRRNVYGENDKSSRKNIPRRKRLVNKANRHAALQALAAAAGPADPELAELAEIRLLGARTKVWRKHLDLPLGSYLQLRRERAEQRAARRPG
jgi:hypothetical protein